MNALQLHPMNHKVIGVPTFTPLRFLLGAFVVLSLIYAWTTPIFEASDELWHFGVIQHIANTGELPVQVPGVETPWEQEGSQPPLYYFLVAGLLWVFPAGLLIRWMQRPD